MVRTVCSRLKGFKKGSHSLLPSFFEYVIILPLPAHFLTDDEKAKAKQFKETQGARSNASDVASVTSAGAVKSPKPCWWTSAGFTCPYGDNCHFVHDNVAPAANKQPKAKAKSKSKAKKAAPVVDVTQEILLGQQEEAVNAADDSCWQSEEWPW